MASRSTHCDRGHEFSEENTYVRANGDRQCRECRRMWERARTRKMVKPPYVADAREDNGWWLGVFQVKGQKVRLCGHRHHDALTAKSCAETSARRISKQIIYEEMEEKREHERDTASRTT